MDAAGLDRAHRPMVARLNPATSAIDGSRCMREAHHERPGEHVEIGMISFDHRDPLAPATVKSVDCGEKT
jgi:hypothetical protein